MFAGFDHTGGAMSRHWFISFSPATKKAGVFTGLFQSV